MQTYIDTQAEELSNNPKTNSTTKKESQASKRIRKIHPAPVTRISIEGLLDEQIEESKPRLKSGVHISKANSKEEKPLVVVAAQTAISISHPGARAIVAKFDGHHTANQISEELKAPIDVVENVISRLLSAQLLDIKNSRIKLLNRFQSPIAERAAQTQDQSNDAFFRQLQLRMAPELSQTTWIENIVDGGVEILSARQLFGVEIHGNNRVATLIYAGLLASGVSNTKFSLASRNNNQSIGDSDLGTGVLRINDFGLGYKSRVEELAREWSLFPTARKVGTEKGELPISARNLRVIVGNFQPELAQQLMRDKLDHFFVGEIMGGAALCGPLVIPEQTPCWQCLMLSRSEQLGVEELIPLNPLNDEPPVSIAYQIAGLAIASILKFIDTQRCALTASQTRFNYSGDPVLETVRFPRHPTCSCNWSEVRYPH
jgi:hypothetical protein